jgi:hypothetical protein
MSDFPKTIHAAFADHFDAGVWTRNGALYKEVYHRADLSADLVRAALRQAAAEVGSGEFGEASFWIEELIADPEAIAEIIASVVEGK